MLSCCVIASEHHLQPNQELYVDHYLISGLIELLFWWFSLSSLENSLIKYYAVCIIQRSVQLGNYRAGLLLIMAHTVREMRDEEVDAAFMRKVTKLAMADLSMNKVLSICFGICERLNSFAQSPWTVKVLLTPSIFRPSQSHVFHKFVFGVSRRWTRIGCTLLQVFLWHLGLDSPIWYC